MNTQTVTITEPKYCATLTVPIDVAALVIRAWFCTGGVPDSALKVIRHAGLSNWHYYDPTKIVDYRHMPTIEPGEPFDCYARRVARFVNEYAHFWHTHDRVSLFADLND